MVADACRDCVQHSISQLAKCGFKQFNFKRSCFKELKTIVNRLPRTRNNFGFAACPNVAENLPGKYCRQCALPYHSILCTKRWTSRLRL